MIKHQQILPHAKHEPETWVKNQKQKKEERRNKKWMSLLLLHF